MKRVLCVWFPNWVLQQLAIAPAAPRDASAALASSTSPSASIRREIFDPADAVVIYDTLPRGKRQVVACSYAARRRGIRPGMPLAEATAAQATVPGRLVLRPYDAQQARENLTRLACWCSRYSPTVGIEDSPRAESLLLDATGLAKLFGSETALAERLAAELHEQRWIVRLAVADTVGAAWAVAHYARQAAAGQVHIVPPGETRRALAPLPVESLRLAAETAAALAELGIERVEQLQAIAREALGPRFGEELLRRLDQAEGLAAECITACRPAAEIEACWPFESPTNDRQQIEAVLAQQLTEMAGTLAATRRGAQQLECDLRGTGGMFNTLAVGLLRPSASAQYLFELMRLRLERAGCSEEVSEVRLRVTQTAPLECRQREMFPRGDRSHSALAEATLVERLSSRLGRTAVVRPRLTGDAVPEAACRAEPLLDVARQKRTRRKAQQAPEEFGFRYAQRPLRLARRPVALRVFSAVLDGPPAHFLFQREEHRVTRSWGPERIETGWWRGTQLRRDYYRVETSLGRWFWLFRRLNDGRWFWQGEFD